MAKQTIRLNESEFKSLIKEVILEMDMPGLSEYDAFDGEEYDGEDTIDFDKYGIGDINAVTKGNEYHGENDNNEFNQEDPADAEEKMDADINNDPNRDVNPEDNIQDDGMEGVQGEPNIENGEQDEPEINSPVTPLSEPTHDEEEHHEDGDVIYYEQTPIEYSNGKYHMTIEDGFDMGEAKCPKIDVVGSSLKDVKGEYDHLWDNYYYKDHAQYVKDMMERGFANYDFSAVGGQDPSQINLEELPIIVDLG